MTDLPYVQVILFALGDGSFITMDTSLQYRSPLSCSMAAFMENEKSRDRTYVCVTREDAVALLDNNPEDGIREKKPAPVQLQGRLQ